MDQHKVGDFLKSLRREKGITQEQLAEKLNVSRRTVSRWETGSNMPDLDLLVELADFYGVDLRELLDGERKIMKMDKELEETVIKVAEYSSAEKRQTIRTARAFFAAGIVSLLINAALHMAQPEETFWVGFTQGATFALALIAMVFGILYTTGTLEKIQAFKMRLLKWRK